MRRDAAVALLACALVASTLLPVQTPIAETTAALAQGEPNAVQPVCDAPQPPRFARCHSRIRTDAKVRGRSPQRATEVQPNILGNGGAYDPAFLQSAYNLGSLAGTAGAGRTIAIVDAFDAPSAEADLGIYRSNWGLPPCTTA